MRKQILTQSALIGSSLTIIFITLLTIGGELYTITGVDGKTLNPIKELLKSLHGHHWVGKGIWAIGFFIITTIVMYLIHRNTEKQPALHFYVRMLTYMLILGTVALYGFFTYEFLIHH